MHPPAKVTIEGHSLFFPLIVPQVRVERGAEGSGLVFTDRREQIRLSLESLHANEAKNGARYLYIGREERKIVRVPEHLLSAIFWHGIDDVRVTAPKRQVPLAGPGIKSFYESLRPLRLNSPKAAKLHFYVAKEMTYETTYKGIQVTIQARPAKDGELNIHVLSGKHPDLPDLGEQPFILNNAAVEAEKHLDARAIARLRDKKKYACWRILSRIGFGINEDTYLIARPNDSVEEIGAHMLKKYRSSRNEHLAHTAVCDFPGELRAVAPYISGTFTLSNTNHITRVAAIREFIRNGVLVAR